MIHVIYYKVSAYVIMETEKSHDLPSAKQRPRKVCSLNRLESRRADGAESSSSLKT